MSSGSWRPSPEALKRALELHNRVLSKEEFMARLAIPLTPEEIEDNLALIRWFRTRYPTAAERLADVRRAYKRWTQA